MQLNKIKGRVSNYLAERALSRPARLVLHHRLTYLSPIKLQVLEKACRSIAADNVPGGVVEYGVAGGGSAIVLATLAQDRPFMGFDLFGTIPPPGPADGADAHSRYAVIKSGQSEGIGGDAYYGYEPDLLEKVKQRMAEAGVPVDGDRVRLVPGLFEETVADNLPEKISIAHIDCDWHDPVALCLRETWDRLSLGGLIILDDYFDYSGCRAATDAFLKATPAMQVMSRTGNLVLRRAR